MRIKKLIMNCFMAVFVMSSCKNNITEAEETNDMATVSAPQLTINNETTVEKNNNVFEITQYFLEKNMHSAVLSKEIEMDLSETSGAMISAFSENKADYTLFYRTFEKDIWTDWIELKENKEVTNPDRKVFAPKHLNFIVKKIQFKSSKNIEDKVIFRIYTFQKN